MRLTRFDSPRTAPIISALIALLVIPGATLAQDAEEPTQPVEMAQLRFLHGAQAGPLDLFVGGQLAGEDLASGQVSSYADVPAGEQFLELVDAGADLEEARAANEAEPGAGGFAEATVKLKPNQAYTVVAVADAAGLNELRAFKDKPKPKPGKTMVRIIGLCSNCGPVEFLADESKKPIAKDLHYLEQMESPYVSVKPGELDLRMRESGTKQTVADFDPITLEPGTSNTIFAIGWVINDTMALVPVVDAAISSARFMNASREPKVVDIYVDGKQAVKRLYPGQAAHKASNLLAGEHLVQVVEAGTKPDAGTLLEGIVDFPAGATAVEAVAGESLEAVSAPTGMAPRSKSPKIRFAHIDPEIPAVDIEIRDADPVLGLEAGEWTEYITMPTSSTYMWIRPSDDPMDIYHELPLDLPPSGNVTAYLGGSAAIPTVELVFVDDPVAKGKKS